MKVEIEGKLYHAVPSVRCRSVVGDLRCSQFGTTVRCGPLECTAKRHQSTGVSGICFLDDDDFTKWLVARLTK